MSDCCKEEKESTAIPIKTVSQAEGGNNSSCGCSGQEQTAKPIMLTSVVKKMKPYWVSGVVSTPLGDVDRVTTAWTKEDRWGSIKSRISAFRMKYIVDPGLYAVGNPDGNSDIFVSANYKLSFDVLRRELRGMDAWILVLDTKGINVWCAAGKGTFGTEELVKRIQEARLDQLLNHKRVIVPQLGAPGVSAPMVKKMSGFIVKFGPVEARQIPEYVAARYKKTPEMKQVRFTMKDRVVLTPMETIPAMKKFPYIALAILLIFGLQPAGLFFKEAWFGGYPFLILTLLTILAGSFFVPTFLPFIPFRSFAIKGWLGGVATVALFFHFYATSLDIEGMTLQVIAYLFFPLLSSYIALQFTGSTTYTGMSGVRKELKLGVPVYFSGLAITALLVIYFKINQWGLL